MFKILPYKLFENSDYKNFLKSKFIRYDTFDEMIDIAKKLNEIGLRTYTPISRMIRLQYNYFAYDKNEESFVRWGKTAMENEKIKDSEIISYLEFLNSIGAKKIKRIFHPDDPYGEEDDWTSYVLDENKKSEIDLRNTIITRIDDDNRNILMKFLDERGVVWDTGDSLLNSKYVQDKEAVRIDGSLKMTQESVQFYKWIKRSEYNNYQYIDCDDIINNNYIKIRNKDIDPYGEENWGYEIVENKDDNYYWRTIKLPEKYPNATHAWVWLMDNEYSVVNKEVSFMYKDWDFETNDYELDEIIILVLGVWEHNGFLFLTDKNKAYKVSGKEILVKEKGRVFKSDMDPYAEEVWEMRRNKYTPDDHVIREIEPLKMLKNLLGFETKFGLFVDLSEILKKKLIGKVCSFPVMGKNSKGEDDLHGANNWTITDVYVGEDKRIHFVGHGRLSKEEHDVILAIGNGRNYKIYYEEKNLAPRIDPYGEEDWD